MLADKAGLRNGAQGALPPHLRELSPGEARHYLGEPPRCVLYLDTNVLLESPDLQSYRLNYRDVMLVVLEEVVRELEGLSHSSDHLLGPQARRAFRAMENLLQTRGIGVGIPVGKGGHRVRISGRSGQAGRTWALAGPPVDECLVDGAAEHQRREPTSVVAVVTRDKGVSESARLRGVQAVLLPGPVNNASLQEAVRKLVSSRG